MNGTKHTLRLFGAMIVAAGILGMTAVQADAAPARSATPAAVSASNAVEIVTVATVRPAPLTKAAAAAKQKCWYNHGVVTAKIKKTGIKLFVFEQIVNWCGKKGKMTKVTGQQAYFSHLAGGVNVTKQPSSKLTKVAKTYWVSRSSASVKFCILRVGCVAHYSPWISTTMHGNGKRTSNGGF